MLSGARTGCSHTKGVSCIMVQKAEHPPSGPRTADWNNSGHSAAKDAKLMCGRKKGCMNLPLFVGTSLHVIDGHPLGVPKRDANVRCMFCGFFPLVPALAVAVMP